jgi:hypothetical protein
MQELLSRMLVAQRRDKQKPAANIGGGLLYAYQEILELFPSGGSDASWPGQIQFVPGLCR